MNSAMNALAAVMIAAMLNVAQLRRANHKIGPGKASTFIGDSAFVGARHVAHRDGKVVRIETRTAYTPQVAARCAELREIRAQHGVGRPPKRHAEAAA